MKLEKMFKQVAVVVQERRWHRIAILIILYGMGLGEEGLVERGLVERAFCGEGSPLDVPLP